MSLQQNPKHDPKLKRKFNTIIHAIERELTRLIDLTAEADPGLRLLDIDKARIIRALRTWNLMAVAKYVEGQKEHGGSITDRPCLTEIRKELIDSMFYLDAAEEKLNSRGGV